MRARMCRITFCLTLSLWGTFALGRPENETTSLKVTMCDLYTTPQKYAGKMIEVRATIVGYQGPTLEPPAFAAPEPCAASGYMKIALELPQTAKPKPDFELVQDESFKKYEEALQKPMRIEATLQGRFDPVFVWQNHKRVRVGEGQGYGKSHSADGRLLLRKIDDVVTRYMPRR
jgi:hypothetical protein